MTSETPTRQTIFGDLCMPGSKAIPSAYRYQLYRREPIQIPGAWTQSAETLAFVMLNPSTANATRDDPTIRRCRGFATRFGARHLYVVNLFAYRATDPKALIDAYRKGLDIIGPRNDQYLSRVSQVADMVIAAWGTGLPRALEWKATHIRERLRTQLPGKTYHLGLTKHGQPRHPLYVRKNADPALFG